MKISLRPLKLDDKNLFYIWWNDMEIRALTAASDLRILPHFEVDQMIEENLADKNRTEFIIEADSKPIGHINISENNRKRYFTIDIAIGEKDYWNKGHGSEALKLAVNWFRKNRSDEEALELEVNTDNPRAARCYEKVGFEKITRKHYDNYKDTFLMRLILHKPKKKGKQVL